MKWTSWVAVCLAAVVLVSLIAGCEEENISDVKKHRLIAVENKELKAEVEKLDKKVAKLEDDLAQCRTDRDKWEVTATETIQKNVRGILGHAMEKNVQLREENVKLKAEIEQLKQRGELQP